MAQKSERLFVSSLTCGLANYAFYLTDALAKLGCECYVVVLSRFGQKTPRYFQWLARQIPLDAELVLTMHEYGLFDSNEDLFYKSIRDYLAYFNKPLTPIVTTMHSAGKFEEDDVIHAYNDAVVVHNKFCHNAFGKEDAVIIPMGTRKVENLPKPEIAKARWGIEGKTVGVFGFLSPHKGMDDVINAVSKLKDTMLLVGGGWHVQTETTYMQWLKNTAMQSTQGKAVFTDYIQNEDLGNFFGACDVLVVPHRFITGSMSLATALGYGRPVIARHVTAFIELERMGYIQTFNSVNDLTTKLEAILEDPMLQETMKQRAYGYANNFNWQTIGQKYIDVFNRLLEETKKKKEAETAKQSEVMSK